MTAVDLPPGLRFPGLGVGEFQAQPAAARLARRVFILVLLIGGVAAVLSIRRILNPVAEMALAITLLAFGIAIMGFLVRRARLRVEAGGVRWGWDLVGFTLRREELSAINVYTDAVALLPHRGSTWYVSARDWDRFDELAPALAAAGLTVQKHARTAPLGARMQSYGRVLNGLLIIDVGLALLGLLTALSVG